jgi:hypothetical protein
MSVDVAELVRDAIREAQAQSGEGGVAVTVREAQGIIEKAQAEGATDNEIAQGFERAGLLPLYMKAR